MTRKAKWLTAGLLLLLAAVSVLSLHTNKPADPMSLPEEIQVTSISLETPAGTAGVCTDPERIAQILTALSEAVPTAKASVQDAPLAEHYGKIDISHGDRITTVFYYTENGKNLVEQPYQGIYETQTDLESLITQS